MTALSEPMKTSDFSYALPDELIAQSPLPDRAASRLMVLPRENGTPEHSRFSDLPALLHPEDLLVFNDSKVLPARLTGVLPTGGACELLLLREHAASGEGSVWECLARPGRRLRAGVKVDFGGGLLRADILSVLPDGNRLVRFQCEGVFAEALDQLGEMPLPPYIHEKLADPARYQTVYARVPGSAAAPTAGLHFTDPLLAQLRERGIHSAYVTLHVGLGTFRPVRVADVASHRMHSEWFQVSPEAADAVARTREAGGRVIAVGTTACRTLESCACPGRLIRPRMGETDIFLRPADEDSGRRENGSPFQVVDGLITNFHLPESTLLMLVSALAGRERVLDAYREAVNARYRFFSFGDAMLIL